MRDIEKNVQEIWDSCVPTAEVGSVDYYWEKIKYADNKIQVNGKEKRGKGFLTCQMPRNGFVNLQKKIAFFSLNPGDNLKYTASDFAKTEAPMPPTESCPADYFFHEEWNGVGSGGKAPLQVQLQHFFWWLYSYRVHKSCPVPEWLESPTALMKIDMPHNGKELAETISTWVEEDVLSAYFVPFRSKNEKGISKKSWEFAEILWKNVFTHWCPDYVFTISLQAFNTFRAFNTLKSLGTAENCCIPVDCSTGWGKSKYNVEIITMDNNKQFVLARLPHFSYYKLFSCAKCYDPLKKFFKLVFAQTL